MNRDDPSEATDPAADAAAAWVIRLERGLTPEEQDRLSDWLAADSRHRPALPRMRAPWDRLAPPAPSPPEHRPDPNPPRLALPPTPRPRLPRALPSPAAPPLPPALPLPTPPHPPAPPSRAR